MLSGTEMSMSMRLLARPPTSSGRMMGSSAPVAAKTTSASPTTRHKSSIGAAEALEPPRPATTSSSSSARARSTDLLTTVTRMSGNLLKRAMTKSRAIFPAPRTATRRSAAAFLRSGMAFIAMSSTAALEVETEPLPMPVFVRTSFPTPIAACNILAMNFPPKPGARSAPTSSRPSAADFRMECSWQAFTCAKIWASPSTKESKPELTSKTCLTACAPTWWKTYSSNCASSKPVFALRKARTISKPEYRLISGVAK
mmetsp:Transcript_35165/g.100172  ORF Transcript_35165/g.100172 Transcript_35165/m.100172 type:complete len:256 (+) Transcript_35165:617-1384(+)